MLYILVDEDDGLINVFKSSEEMIDHFNKFRMSYKDGVETHGFEKGSLELDCFYYFVVDENFTLNANDIDQEAFIFGAIEKKGLEKSDELIKDHPIFCK